MKDAIASALERIEAASEKVSAELSEATGTLVRVSKTAGELERADAPRNRAPLEDLGAAMSDLSERAEATSSVHILHHHLGALAAAASAFVWLAEENPPAAVQAAITDAEQHTSVLRSKNEPHSELGDAVDAFLSALAGYVDSEHKTALAWADEQD